MPRQKTEAPLRSPEVQALIASIQKDYGQGAILDLQGCSLPGTEFISSGSISLDLALGGGYARGRMVEVFGPESAGKSTVCLHAIASAQRQGLLASYIDVEHALDIDYAKNLGVDTSLLLISQPGSMEEALDILDKMCRSGTLGAIVVDSTNALVPKAELEGEVGDQLPGLQARLLSKALRMIVGFAYDTKTLVLWASQLRKKVGFVLGNPEVVGVGEALRFYASQRVDIRRIATTKEGEEAVSNVVRVKVAKNKVAPPYRTTELSILFGQGIDTIKDLFNTAKESGIISQSGHTYEFNGERLAVGADGCISHLREHPELSKQIRSLVLEAGYGKTLLPTNS